MIGVKYSISFKDFILNYFNNIFLDNLPLLSWIKSIFMMSLNDNNFSNSTIASLILMNTFLIVVIYIFYKTIPNYYEEVVTNPEAFEKDTLKESKVVKVERKLNIILIKK